jgi:hypothetical protein
MIYFKQKTKSVKVKTIEKEKKGRGISFKQGQKYLVLWFFEV